MLIKLHNREQAKLQKEALKTSSLRLVQRYGT